VHGEQQKEQDHHVQPDGEREGAEQKAQALTQAVFESRLFLLRVFFVQMCARGNPEQDHRHDNYRDRKQANFFRDGHAMSFIVMAPCLLPRETAPVLQLCAARRRVILCSR